MNSKRFETKLQTQETEHSRHGWRPGWIALLTTGLLALLPSRGAAEDLEHRAFVVATQESGPTADRCKRAFSAPMTRSQLYVERSDELISGGLCELVDAVSNPTSARQCALSAAAGGVDYVAFIGMQRDEESLFFDLRLVSVSGNVVWSASRSIDRSSGLDGIQGACEELGAEVVSHEMKSRDSSDTADLKLASLRVHDVDPAPATLWCGGREVGPIPATFARLAPGPRRCEVRAPGYQPQAFDIVLEPNRELPVPAIRLRPLPAVLRIRSNTVGAIVEIDGERAGVIAADGTSVLNVTHTARIVKVSKNGFSPFAAKLELFPGAEANIIAQLAAGSGGTLASGDEAFVRCDEATVSCIEVSGISDISNQTATGLAGGGQSGPSNCPGWYPSSPQHVVMLQSGLRDVDLRVHRADGDTMLWVEGPAGHVCIDDTIGSNPVVRSGFWQPGEYRVFVGSFGQRQFYKYELRFSGRSSL